MTTKLPVHEWCIILLFCSILLALAGFAWGRPKSVIDSIALAPQSSLAKVLQIKIEGQVAKPGLYYLPLRATLKELFEQAQPLPSADLSQFKGRRKLRDGQTIFVPERHFITIQIAGAVRQPGSLKILSGTRYSELADQLEILPEGDLKPILRKKSFVHEGDCIRVPSKKKRQTKKVN